MAICMLVYLIHIWHFLIYHFISTHILYILYDKLLAYVLYVSSENPDLQAMRILRMSTTAQIAWMVCGPLPVVAEVALQWLFVGVLVLETCTNHGFIWIFGEDPRKWQHSNPPSQLWKESQPVGKGLGVCSKGVLNWPKRRVSKAVKNTRLPWIGCLTVEDLRKIVRRCSSANFAHMFCILCLLNAEVCWFSWPSLVFHSLSSWALIWTLLRLTLLNGLGPKQPRTLPAPLRNLRSSCPRVFGMI